MVFEANVRWRPRLTCWGCDSLNRISIGFGLDPGLYVEAQAHPSAPGFGVIVLASVDLLFVLRFREHLGLSLGTRAGAGPHARFGGSNDGVGLFFQLNLVELGLVF